MAVTVGTVGRVVFPGDEIDGMLVEWRGYSGDYPWVAPVAGGDDFVWSPADVAWPQLEMAL